MTARTLEEIEALAAEANASGETTRMRAMEFPRLLAIAQEQRAEIAAMRKVIDIARVCANEGGYKECPRTDDHHIALLEMDKAIKAIGAKR